MTFDLMFFLVAIPAVLITGVSKGGFGGVATLSVPLLSLVISPVAAAGIMLPILIAMDAMGMWAYRRDFDARHLTVLLPGACLGIAAGYATVGWMSDDIIRLCLAAIIAAFLMIRLLDRTSAGKGVISTGTNHADPGPPDPGQPRPGAPRPDLEGGSDAGGKSVDRPQSAQGTVWGAVSGYTSYLAHAGSPPMHIYLIQKGLTPRAFAATGAFYFAIVNLIKLPPYFLTGQLSTPNLLASAILLPLAPVGIALGIYLNKRLDRAAFFRVLYGALAVVAVKLAYDGLTGIL